MTVGYGVSLTTPDDISGILVLQEPNLPGSGGSLAVRLTEDWFRRAISEKSIVVGRGNRKVVGMCRELRSQQKRMWRLSRPCCALSLLHPIVICMSVCVAGTERAKGLAGAMFKTLLKHKNGRPAMTFVKADNEMSFRVARQNGNGKAWHIYQ